MVKSLPASSGDSGLIPGLGELPEVGHGNPLQYSSLENAMGTRSERMWSLMLSPDGEVY